MKYIFYLNNIKTICLCILLSFLLKINSTALAQSDKELKKIVLNDTRFKNKIEALKKIKNQDVLYQIVIESNDSYLNSKVIAFITDTTLLRNIALNCKANEQAEVFKRYKNQELIKKFILNNSDWLFIDYSIFSYVEDSKFLENIVSNTTYRSSFRGGAAKYLPDNDFKKKLVLNRDELDDVRISAINTFKDNDILYKLLKTESEVSIRKALVNAMDNQEYLEETALNEADMNIRCIAICKLNDQNTLVKISSFESYYDANLAKIRLIFVDEIIKNKYGEHTIEFTCDSSIVYYQLGTKLYPHSLSINVVSKRSGKSLYKNNFSCDIPSTLRLGGGGDVWATVDYASICKSVLDFTDDSLSIIVATTKSEQLKNTAKSILDQNAQLNQLKYYNIEDSLKIIKVINGLDVNHRLTAIALVDNEIFYKHFSAKDKSEIVRKSAVSKLQDQAMLYWIILNDESYEVRFEACKSLKDQEKIVDLLSNYNTIYDNILVKNLNEQSQIARALKADWKRSSNYFEAKEALLAKNKDEEVADFVLLNEKNVSVREAALQYVNNQNAIEKFVNTESDDWKFNRVKQKAIMKMTNKNALQQLKKHTDKYIRFYAKLRLNQL